MEILAKKVTDQFGDVWVLIYEDGHLQEPLTLLKQFEAEILVSNIQNQLNERTISPKFNHAKEVPQKNATPEG